MSGFGRGVALHCYALYILVILYTLVILCSHFNTLKPDQIGVLEK